MVSKSQKSLSFALAGARLALLFSTRRDGKHILGILNASIALYRVLRGSLAVLSDSIGDLSDSFAVLSDFRAS